MRDFLDVLKDIWRRDTAAKSRKELERENWELRQMLADTRRESIENTVRALKLAAKAMNMKRTA